MYNDNIYINYLMRIHIVLKFKRKKKHFSSCKIKLPLCVGVCLHACSFVYIYVCMNSLYWIWMHDAVKRSSRSVMKNKELSFEIASSKITYGRLQIYVMYGGSHLKIREIASYQKVSTNRLGWTVCSWYEIIRSGRNNNKDIWYTTVVWRGPCMSSQWCVQYEALGFYRVGNGLQ